MKQSFLSAQSLLRCQFLTRDGSGAGITELILDTLSWWVRFLAIEAGPGVPADRGARGGGEAKPLRCLPARTGIDWLDPSEQTLHLAVFIQEIRDAPTWPLPVAGRANARVRTLVPAS